MNERLKIKKCMISLERELNISIIDYITTQESDSVIFLINAKDRLKWRKNKSIIRKLSKRVGKYLHYISLPCSIKRAARQCIYPVKIEDVVLKRNNGETTLIYLIDQCIKDFLMNKYGPKFKLSEILLKKHFAIDNIKIKGINSRHYDYHEKLLVSDSIR